MPSAVAAIRSSRSERPASTQPMAQPRPERTGREQLPRQDAELRLDGIEDEGDEGRTGWAVQQDAAGAEGEDQVDRAGGAGLRPRGRELPTQAARSSLTASVAARFVNRTASLPGSAPATDNHRAPVRAPSAPPWPCAGRGCRWAADARGWRSRRSAADPRRQAPPLPRRPRGHQLAQAQVDLLGAVGPFMSVEGDQQDGDRGGEEPKIPGEDAPAEWKITAAPGPPGPPR